MPIRHDEKNIRNCLNKAHNVVVDIVKELVNEFVTNLEVTLSLMPEINSTLVCRRSSNLSAAFDNSAILFVLVSNSAFMRFRESDTVSACSTSESFSSQSNNDLVSSIHRINDLILREKSISSFASANSILFSSNVDNSRCQSSSNDRNLSDTDRDCS